MTDDGETIGLSERLVSQLPDADLNVVMAYLASITWIAIAPQIGFSSASAVYGFGLGFLVFAAIYGGEDA